MLVFHQLSEIENICRKGTAIAIGNFDGVHLGHHQLLQNMLRLAKNHSWIPTVLTFYPHPVEVLQPGKRLERLMTASEKLKALESLGIEIVLVQKFDTALAQLSADEFFNRFLVEGLHARSLHVGSNFMFGRGRQGNTARLEELCEKAGCSLNIEPPVEAQNEKVSSSLIRECLLNGDVEKAKKLLGRPFSITGDVVQGDHRGKSLGFPTANLRFPVEKIIPKTGVYTTRALWQGQAFLSVTNVGYRPTFHVTQSSMTERPSVEVHFLDFDTRLYDETVTLEYHVRLRDEKKFESGEALIRQIQEDIQKARAWGKSQ